MQFAVSVEHSPAAFTCRPGQSVLAAMSAAGARELPVGCRSGGCGVCRVQVLAGDFDCGLMSGAQISPEDRAQGVVLACQTFPRSDLRVRALGRCSATGEDATAALLRSLARAACDEARPR